MLPSEPPDTAAPPEVLKAVERLSGELERLRKILLRHGHAQELFQQRVGEQVDRLARHVGPEETGKREDPKQDQPQTTVELSKAQLRALLELDRAVLHLHLFARGTDRRETDNVLEDAPASVREGLDLLQIRVRNLQRSFHLEPIPALRQPFDDRLHQAHSVSHRADLPDGQIVEELLPGYRLHGQVLRPALVVVNRSEPAPASQDRDSHE